MSGQSPEKKKKRLDLTEALRILQNAGKSDPRQLTDDLDVQIQCIIDALCQLSIHDGMTGLFNVTFFHAALTREIERSLRTGRTCGLMVMDIDHFKQINDTHGHAAGDIVLRSVGSHLKHGLRSMDTAARIGGEEFAVILPECDPEDAIHAATRIHEVFNPLTVAVGRSILRVTTSVGLVWTNLSLAVSSSALLAQADQEMYKAKRSGRGRLCHPAIETTLVTGQERSALMALRIEGDIDGL